MGTCWLGKKINVGIFWSKSLILAYKAEDTQVLAEKFDISGEFLEEIYEMFDFVEDKSVLHLFPIEEMDKKEGRSTTGGEN